MLTSIVKIVLISHMVLHGKWDVKWYIQDLFVSYSNTCNKTLCDTNSSWTSFSAKHFPVHLFIAFIPKISE